MRRVKVATAILLTAPLLLQSACGGHAGPSVPVDSTLEQTASSGRQALDFDHPAQAVQHYQHAFALALARNDAGAIGDCGYDLATAQLADRDPLGALQTAERTRTALAVRSAPSFAELDLVEAAALFRLDRADEADRLAANAQSTAQDPATVSRASMLRGLIAYARGDEAGVAAALSAFGAPKHPSPDWQADHDALAARQAMLRGEPADSARLAQQAADIQRTQLHYREMAESLAFAGDALHRAGQPIQAADLYLQAGESAAARGDTMQARQWLDLASAQGASITTAKAAADALARLKDAGGQ